MISDSREVYFIIPVYNEGEVIKGVIQDVLKFCPNIVCVDDGSTDNSADEIRTTSAYIVQHPINMGQGAALQTGIEFARKFENADYYVSFDADGQHRLEDVAQMLKVLKKEKMDIVLGSRFLGKMTGATFTKRWFLMLAIKFSNVTSGLELTDTHNGLRVFNRKVADGIQITMSDMAHASEILEIIRANNYKYVEVPVEIVYTDYSHKKGQSLLNAVNIAFDLLLRRIMK